MLRDRWRVAEQAAGLWTDLRRLRRVLQLQHCTKQRNTLIFGSPTRARTWDLRINRPALSWDRILNQALATHAKFQEQQDTALNERHEAETSYEMATLLNVEKRLVQCVLSPFEDLEYGCAGLHDDPETTRPGALKHRPTH